VVVACGTVALAGVALAPLLRRNAQARFLALGAVLSAIPFCATFPSARLSLVPGFGLVGLVAIAFVAWRDQQPPRRPRALAAFGAIAGGIHLFLSPPLLLVMIRQSAATEQAVTALLRKLPDEPGVSRQRLVVVNLPDLLFTIYLRAALAAQAQDRAVPLGSFLVGLGTHELQLARTDERTLTVSDPRGFFGHDFSMLFRPEGSPMPVVTRVPTPTVSAEVEASREGIPTRVAFRFTVPLEDPSLRWLVWDGDTLVPFQPPALETSVVIPARPHPLLRMPSAPK
jgi:hypothetical protein